ncbi:unnamed protein product [Owenia fusiformis]|uniref:Uncharacterized protein n=1 Tax=Owenia fusiformis TaxID=6347 RepID=A0A8J1TM29_OWEFU|nr:unnamed protein product [Owenia fusiformis]
MPKKNKYTLNQGASKNETTPTRVRRTHGAVSSDVPLGTPVEVAALQKFKMQVLDILDPRDNDFKLMKWLKARDFDVEKAEIMYKNHLDFREKYKLDTLLDDYTPPEVIQKYLTGGLLGYDKEGSPIRVEKYGQLDMKGIMYSVKQEDLIKSKLYHNELVVREWEKQTKKLGKHVHGLTVLFDMENVGTGMLWRPGLQMYLQLVKTLEDNYPEMMKQMFVINAPRIFPLLWKVARPLMSEHTKQKIQVLGSDYKEVLQRYIDADQLPGFLGGTITDPDGNPDCKTLLVHGGQVPEKYFLKDLSMTDTMETALVPNGEKLQIVKFVTEPNSILRWEFLTEDFDVGFGVNYIPEKGNKVKPVVPIKRVNCHMVPEDGSVECKLPGPYKVVFDNTFSWTRSKTIFYHVEVIAPTDDVMQKEINERVQNGTWEAVAKQMEVTKI